MRASEWRALIAAYVEGRLSADAFRRRFLEAFEGAAAQRAPTPGVVQDLYYVVEAYAGDPMGRGHAVSDDADLMAAARAALDGLRPEPEPAFGAPPPEEGPRVVIMGGPDLRGAGFGGSQQARRMVWTVGGLGCGAALAYLGLGILQFFAVAAQIDAVLSIGPAPATILALFIAFVPLLGGVVAFFGAADVWGWPMWAAGLVFLFIPALTAFGGWRMIRRG